MVITKQLFKQFPQTSKVNVHIYQSPFKNESRILKITKTLSDADVFDKIYIIATWENGLPETEVLDAKTEVVRIHSKLGEDNKGVFWKTIKTLEWSWRIKKFLKQHKIHCINCHSLPVLPLCVFLKIVYGAKLVYDTHELETETVGSKGVRKLLSKMVEKSLIFFIDEIIVVNDSIADWYRKEYKLSAVWSVKNVPYNMAPPQANSTIFRDKFNIGENGIIFLYQGAIVYGRGINILLDVFSKANKVNGNKHIIFMGYGDLVDLVCMYEKKFPNIHFHPAVDPNEIIQYTASADVGLSIIENVCLSYYLCFPNKLFEYINCGLPVIVSNFPVMANFVDKYDCGWKVSINKHEITSIINSINQKAVCSKREKALSARESFGWHLEEPILLNVYRRLGFYN